MPATTPLLDGPVSVLAYRCDSGGAPAPYPEQHHAWSLSYVHSGSFGCRSCGKSHELVPGSLLVGRPADEFLCTHDHHLGGDACLAFFFAPELVDEIAGARVGGVWQSGSVPPLAELVVLGELATHCASGASDIGLDELGLALASRFVATSGARRRAPLTARAVDRGRAVESALWIEAHATEPVALQGLAVRCGLSLFHYLRLFSAVLGVTPHQYLVRCRLRNAARLLADEDHPITDVALDAGFADLSNFVRTFGRAAGTSPRGYRLASRGDRKIFQARMATPS